MLSKVHDVTKGIDTLMISDSYTHLQFTPPFRKTISDLKELQSFREIKEDLLQEAANKGLNDFLGILFSNIQATVNVSHWCRWHKELIFSHSFALLRSLEAAPLTFLISNRF